jgi:hypothetical protein
MLSNNRPHQRARLALAFIMAFSAGVAHSADDRVKNLEGPVIEAVGTTPKPGPGTPVVQVPSNAQVNTGKHVVCQPLLSLPDFKNQCMPPVGVA